MISPILSLPSSTFYTKYNDQESQQRHKKRPVARPVSRLQLVLLVLPESRWKWAAGRRLRDHIGQR